MTRQDNNSDTQANIDQNIEDRFRDGLRAAPGFSEFVIRNRASLLNRRKFLGLSAIAGLTVLTGGSLVGCADDTEEAPTGNAGSTTTVKVAYLPITHALPVLVAAELEQQLESNVHIETVKFGSWPEIIDALRAGQVDSATLLIELAMKAKLEGIDLKAVALGHRDGNVIVSKPDITDAAALAGKTIAIPHRQSSHNILIGLALDEAGLTYTDVEIVEMAPAEMPSALAGGTIDAYCVAEPMGAKGVTSGAGHVLFDSTDLWPHSLCCALAYTSQFLDEKPEAAQAFMQTYIGAGHYIEQNPDEVEELAKTFFSTTQDVLDLSFKWISYSNLEITETEYTNLSDKIKQFGIQDAPPTFDDFVNSSLIQAVEKA